MERGGGEAKILLRIPKEDNFEEKRFPMCILNHLAKCCCHKSLCILNGNHRLFFRRMLPWTGLPLLALMFPTPREGPLWLPAWSISPARELGRDQSYDQPAPPSEAPGISHTNRVMAWGPGPAQSQASRGPSLPNISTQHDLTFPGMNPQHMMPKLNLITHIVTSPNSQERFRYLDLMQSLASAKISQPPYLWSRLRDFSRVLSQKHI